MLLKPNWGEPQKHLTVPLRETMMVPIKVPKRRPADMVNGIAGTARI